MKIFSVLIFCIFVAASVFADGDFDKMTPSQHLERAKQIFNTQNNWGAKLHLKAIPPSASEYKEAKKMLAAMPAIEKEQAKTTSYLKDATVEIRKQFAKKYEHQMLSKGMDVHASTSGKNDTIFKIKWVLVSRPLVYKLINEGNFTQNLKDMGFKKLVMSDGYNQSWTTDL